MAIEVQAPRKYSTVVVPAAKWALLIAATAGIAFAQSSSFGQAAQGIAQEMIAIAKWVGTTLKHIKLIVNWFESHRIVGPIGTAVKVYRKESCCKYVDVAASVVIWGPTELATAYPPDENTILRSRHRKFLDEVQTAADRVTIEDPSDFDAKMASLGTICAPHQAPTIALMKEQFLTDWRMALAFEQKLDGTLPPLRRALEDNRRRIAQKVSQLIIASERPHAELARAGQIAKEVLAHDFATFGPELLEAISSGEVARLIGECPIGWEAPTSA